VPPSVPATQRAGTACSAAIDGSPLLSYVLASLHQFAK
jgi:hypothetical protein